MTAVPAPEQRPSPVYQVSSSRIDLFRVCPFRAYRKYVLGIPEPDTEATVLGSAVHAILTATVNQAKSEGKWPTARAIKPLIDEHTRVAAETGLLTKTALSDIGRLARKALKILQDMPLDADVLESELHFSVPVPGIEGVEFQGYADLVIIQGEAGIILDWKTSRKPYEVVHDPKRQLQSYVWALAPLFPQVKQWSVHLHFLRHDAVSVAVCDPVMKAEAEAYIRHETTKIIGYIRSGEYPATPSSNCRNCPAAMECPAATGQIDLELWSDADAQALFGALLANEARIDLIKQRLRAWVDANGAIRLPEGYYLGYYRGVHQVWEDKTALIEVLKQCGLDPTDFFVPDNTALRKAAEDYPALGEIAKCKETYRQFKHSGTDPDLMI